MVKTTEPTVINAGDSASWIISLADYPASSWTLKYAVVNDANKYDITATPSGDDHAVTIAAATTTAWVPGKYRLVAYVESGAERVTLYERSLLVEPDPTQAGDRRTFAEKIVDAIEAVLLNKATKDQQSMTIDGNSITRYSHEELIKLRDRFRREAKQDRLARLARKTGKFPRRAKVRFR